MSKQDVYGYAGKILRIDLTTGQKFTEPTLTYAREWLGGSGIDQWILYNELKPWITPYAPANKLLFGAGPLVGTLAPGAGSRLTADSKNALTLGVGSSNSCGNFAPELKFAGYDHLIIQGKARKPVYLWIKDDQVELRDASNLWGKTTWETDELIRQELNDDNVQIACIGPAGENIVRGACIIVNRNRALGRCGLGSVMGSKNLKAIAVRGTGEIQVADPSRFMKAVDESRKQFEQSKKDLEWAPRIGTPGGVKGKQGTGSVPYKNFQELVFPEGVADKYDIEGLQKYKIRNMSYLACPVPCSRHFRISDGKYAGLETEGFQMEVLMCYAGKLAVEDPLFCAKVNAYCNQMGLDVDNPAGAIGWAMECYQRGILSQSDTDGLKLEWGNTEVILELIRKIAYREGFGNLLGEGCAHAADLLGRGSDYYAMHIKGQDLYEVLRSSVGWALSICVSTRGGAHTTGSPIGELDPLFDQHIAKKLWAIDTVMQPFVYECKSELVGYFEKLQRINNCLGRCHLSGPSSYFNPRQPDHFAAELYSAATGWETTQEDLEKTAVRILNVEKAFNLLHTNFGRKDDYPPRRCFEEAVPSGPTKGFKLDKEKWDQLLSEYYEGRGWNRETGYPTRKRLEELGLKQVADDLERAGRLGDDN